MPGVRTTINTDPQRSTSDKSSLQLNPYLQDCGRRASHWAAVSPNAGTHRTLEVWRELGTTTWHRHTYCCLSQQLTHCGTWLTLWAVSFPRTGALSGHYHKTSTQDSKLQIDDVQMVSEWIAEKAASPLGSLPVLTPTVTWLCDALRTCWGTW